MVLIQTKSIRRVIKGAIGATRKVKSTVTPANAKKISIFVTKKVIGAKKKVKAISKKELSYAHAQVKKELYKAKVHLYNAEKKIVSIVKKNPQQAISFAGRIAHAIGVGVLAGLKESSSVQSKKPVKKRKASRVKKQKKR